MASVELVNVTKRFGDVVAVNNVSLKVRSGEFFAILGPSGCGKTTLLRLIAGLETPDTGEIYIGGVLQNHLHPRDRDVAMVFQNYALYPHMTVLENIMFPLEVRRKQLGLTKEEIKKRAIYIASLLGIQELLNRYPRELSGGQQQRVALARALVRKPKVWLLDEPLSNLDAKLRVRMRGEIKSLQRKLGITTIYVTHDQAEAMSMADRIAIMHNGKVLQVGAPEELYERPSDTFVATFIGTPAMNLIECSIMESEGGRLIANCLGAKVSMEKEIARALLASRRTEFYMGIRPENLKISRMEPLGGPTIKGKVIIVEPLGSERIVTLDVNGHEVRVKAPREFKAETGDVVYLEVDTQKALYYDKATGKLIA